MSNTEIASWCLAESSGSWCALSNALKKAAFSGQKFCPPHPYTSPIYSEWISNIQKYILHNSYQSTEWVFHLSYLCYLLNQYIFLRFLPKAKRSVNCSDWYFKELETLHWAIRNLLRNRSHLEYRNTLAILSLAKST